jgi:hypothetical protein
LITLDPETHTYVHEIYGKIPSVTQILSEAGLNWFPERALPYLPAASERGTHVHSACDLLDRQELDWSSVEEYRGYVESYQRFLDNYQPEYLETEKEYWTSAEENMAFAGKVDRVWRIPNGGNLAGRVNWNGEWVNEIPSAKTLRVVLDIKTASKLRSVYWAQLAGYLLLYMVNTFSEWHHLPEYPATAVLHLKKDGKMPSLYIRDSDAHYRKVFMASLLLYYEKLATGILDKKEEVS